MLIIGIDTGKTIGFAIYDTETKEMELSEFRDITFVKKVLYGKQPDLIIFEKIVNYGLGIDEAVLRAASEIGFLCCVAHDINAEVKYYTKRAWSSRLCQREKVSKEDRKKGIKPKKITDMMIRNKIVDIFKPELVGMHSSQAAGLIYAYLQEKNGGV